jgi:hypothetical protein
MLRVLESFFQPSSRFSEVSANMEDIYLRTAQVIISTLLLTFSAVTSAVFTDQDVVVSGSDDRTVKVGGKFLYLET